MQSRSLGLERVEQVGVLLGERIWVFRSNMRHTWASWLVQNGTPLYDLQEMGGWKSAEMVRRYAHLAPAQMAKHAAVIGALLHDTNTAQEGIERTAATIKKRRLESEPGQSAPDVFSSELRASP